MVRRMPDEERQYNIDHTEECPWDVDQQTSDDEWAFEEEEDE